MLKKMFRFVLRLVIGFLLLSVVSVIVFRFVPVPFTILMVQRCIEQKADGKEMHLEKDWVPLDKISNNLQLAVVASEDQNFLWHHGFDFDAMKRAMEYNEKQEGRRHPKTRGASTISQQTAKNTFLWPARSYIRKGLEVYFTFLIELIWSKERIMEVYLNIIEMGDGVYGAEAAAQKYFHKHASQLTQAEAARIAAVLPNPRKFKLSAPSGYVLGRQAFIQNQMNLWGGKLDYDMKNPNEEK